MKIIPSILEIDFKSFVEGIQIIQENMSYIFYGKKNKFASPRIEQIFNFVKNKNIVGFGQSSWGPTSFIFCESSKKRNALLNDIENYIKLKKFNNLSLVKVDGRNKGKLKVRN